MVKARKMCPTCEHLSRQYRLWSFFQCALDLRGSVEFFRHRILRLCSIVFDSMMLFKCSFRLTMSLFILHIHEHDCLGFGILTVETAVLNPRAVFDCICRFSSNCGRKDQKGQRFLMFCVKNLTLFF